MKPLDAARLAAAAWVAVWPAAAQATVYLTLEQAQKLMFGDQTLEPLTVTLSPEQMAAIQKDSGVKVPSPFVRAWQAADGGYFFVDAVIGKHDLITYALALTPSGDIRQIEVLEYREPYGSEIRTPGWRGQFTGKHHGAPLMIGNDIAAISGATLSCEHVTEGIRRLLSTYALAIKPA